MFIHNIFLEMRGSKMENSLEVIPIFFAVDDGYIPFLAVAIESLIDNGMLDEHPEILMHLKNQPIVEEMILSAFMRLFGGDEE